MLFDLPPPPRLRLFIERGSHTHCVVRCWYESPRGRTCIDSRLMARSAAKKLAIAIARTGVEVECLAHRFNMVRPRAWDTHQLKRLDEHRLNRVAGLTSAQTMFETTTVLMENESDD